MTDFAIGIDIKAMKKGRRAVRITLVAAVLVHVAVAARAQAPGDGFPELRFLLGRWEASGGGQPGASAGEMTFAVDVQGKVLVRRNESRSPDGLHTDLMVVFRDGAKRLRADFFDSEGHVISYDVTTSANPNRAVFFQASGAGQPGFRFTYTQLTADTLDLLFEVAPPGSETFSTYLHGTASRK